MKALLFTFFLFFTLLSCTTKQDSENKADVDTVRVTHLDYSSPQNFIKTLIENRKKTNSADFKITANVVFSKGDFHIINLIERVGVYEYPYAVVLNSKEKRGFNNPDQPTYIEVQTLLDGDASNIAFFVGNFTMTEDFQGDDSPDFILENVTSFRNEVSGKQTIVLCDKDNLLTVTNIDASSVFESGGGGEGIRGVRETFEIKKKAGIPTIIVHRIEDDYGNKTLSYDKLWKWSKADGVWKTGFKCSSIMKSSHYPLFSQKLTGLMSKDSTFVIQENCQNGGAPFFLLKRVTSEMSDYFMIQTDEDDVGFNAVVSIQQEDSLTYKMILVRGGEEFEPNLSGFASVYPSEPITVTVDRALEDILWFRYPYDPNLFPKTRNPDKYEFIACN